MAVNFESAVSYGKHLDLEELLACIMITFGGRGLLIGHLL
jgi:hypothetical protein